MFTLFLLLLDLWFLPCSRVFLFGFIFLFIFFLWFFFWFFTWYLILLVCLLWFSFLCFWFWCFFFFLSINFFLFYFIFVFLFFFLFINNWNDNRFVSKNIIKIFIIMRKKIGLLNFWNWFFPCWSDRVQCWKKRSLYRFGWMMLFFSLKLIGFIRISSIFNLKILFRLVRMIHLMFCSNSALLFILQNFKGF